MTARQRGDKHEVVELPLHVFLLFHFTRLHFHLTVSLAGAMLTEQYLPRAARRLATLFSSPRAFTSTVHVLRRPGSNVIPLTAASMSRHVSVLRVRSYGFGPSLAVGHAASPSVEALIIRGDVTSCEVARHIS